MISLRYSRTEESELSAFFFDKYPGVTISFVSGDIDIVPDVSAIGFKELTL